VVGRDGEAGAEAEERDAEIEQPEADDGVQAEAEQT
jgi:hypothetical protein